MCISIELPNKWWAAPLPEWGFEFLKDLSALKDTTASVNFITGEMEYRMHLKF